MPLDSAPNKGRYGEIGVSGLTQFSGYIHEEVLSDLAYTKWREVLRLMLANDSTINGLNFVFEMLIRQVSWKLAARDESPQAAEYRDFFHEELFDNLETTWQDTVGEIVGFIPWGWAVHEIVYKKRTDGRTGWRKFAGRAQDSLDHWIFDEEDNATAMVQRGPNTGEIYMIPLAKCLHFRTSTAKNNPEGRSIYRGCYRDWYFKSRLENVEAIGTERDLAGLPVMSVPEALMRKDASPAEKALLAELQSLLKSIRRDESEGVVIPALYDQNNNPLFKLELLSTGGQRQFDTDKIINRYKAQMLSVALADFMMLGSQSKTGSYALSTDKTAMFTTALEAFLDIIADQFNKRAIRDLGRFNGFDERLLPRLEHGDIDKISLTEIFNAVQVMTGAGVVFDEEQQNWIKGQIKMPVTQTGATK